MARSGGAVSRGLRSVGRGRDPLTPFRLVVLVALVVAAGVGLVTLTALLIYYLG